MQFIQILIILSILVLIHELGHYTFARIFGIKIDKFYLFFDAGGLRLFSTRSEWFLKICPKAAEWETEYGIGWLPLGGYCKVNGMIDESMDTGHLKEEPKPWEFRSKPAWQRLLVMIGGILFNFILGIALFWFSLQKWGDAYIQADITPIYVYEDSLGDAMGFKTGDRILALDGEKPVDLWRVQPDIARNFVDKVTVSRGEDTLDIHIDHKYIGDLLSTTLFEAGVPYIIVDIKEDSPNNASGLLPGDRIISIDSTAITYVQEAIPIQKKHAGEQVEVTVLRDSVMHTMLLSLDDKGSLDVYYSWPNVVSLEYSLLEAIPAGFRKAYQATTDQMKDLRLLAMPSTGAYKSVGSVIAIADAMPETWNWHVFINMLAMLSIILGVMNLLPIPALDGGHILFTLYEMVTGRKPSDKFLLVTQIIGMIIIFGLMFLAFGNDITRLINKL